MNYVAGAITWVHNNQDYPLLPVIIGGGVSAESALAQEKAEREFYEYRQVVDGLLLRAMSVPAYIIYNEETGCHYGIQ